MRWQPWSADVFSESAATGRPILLFISTAWSHGCERMEQRTFADAVVCKLIEGRVIPVRVDADERPDIAHRYSLDGWPSTLLLTSDGEVLHGGTYFEPAGLVRLLDGTLRACRDRPNEIARRASDARARRLRAEPGRAMCGASRDTTLRARIASLLAFPGRERFLHGDAVVFLLRHGTHGSIAKARSMLDAADRSPLCREDGAVLRCASSPDWSVVEDETTVEAQASGLCAFAEASSLDPQYRARARRLADFSRRTWLHREAPVTTDAGAQLAAACFAASTALDDRELASEALAWLERITLATYRPGQGVRHVVSVEAPGFASDHIALVSALLASHELTALPPYRMLAEELGHVLVRRFFDDETGAIRDRVHGPADIARLVEPLFPFCWNARAAGALSRLAGSTDSTMFAEVSARLFDWAAVRWEEQGLDAATLGLYLPDQ